MSSEKAENMYMEQRLGTNYPYLDVTNSFRSKIRRQFAKINPLAIEQYSSQDRLNFTLFKNMSFYSKEPYPNPVKFTRFLPAHFDPLGDKPAEPQNIGMQESSGTFQVRKIKQTIFPKVCQRYLGFYKRCVMVNGNEKCKEEENEFLAVCPNFALEDYRDKKLFHQKARIIQRKEYHQAMEVSAYNVGRNVAEFDSRKRWIDGTAAKLRPDSMWIDDRYVDVTQEDIDQAKKRRANEVTSSHHAHSEAHSATDHKHH